MQRISKAEWWNGRHTGLKILCSVRGVRVRVPPRLLKIAWNPSLRSPASRQSTFGTPLFGGVITASSALGMIAVAASDHPSENEPLGDSGPFLGSS